MTTITCPECGKPMVLRQSKYSAGGRQFFGCSGYPRCTITHGANADGTPMGTPANHETRKLRTRCHQLFDQLWKGKSALMRRSEAYELLSQRLGIPMEKAHFAMFNKQECEEAIVVLESMGLGVPQ